MGPPGMQVAQTGRERDAGRNQTDTFDATCTVLVDAADLRDAEEAALRLATEPRQLDVRLGRLPRGTGPR
jgi:hypothetical protein